ncbi:hypothetical protein HKX48_005478 [Thoreauomyces humboldtii]|nr:hypothetical protein HKX48_005478 [Thoreauomyces humboldtii]
MSSNVSIREATIEDCPLIVEFVRDLAEFEKALDKVEADKTSFEKTLFGPHPFAHVVFASLDGKEVGMALYFFNYSTWRGRPGLYLEDLMVRETARGAGVGTALLRYLAQLAVEKGCGRMEWQALDWNTPAVDFYVKKVKATPMDEWTQFRLQEESLIAFAEGREA